MEQLKSYFISFYLILSVSVALYAMNECFNELSLAWLGLSFLALVFPFYVTYQMLLRRTTKSSRYLPFVSTLVGTSFLVTIIGSMPFGETSSITISLGVLLGLFYLLFIFWYSKLTLKESVLKVNELLPLFSLQTVTGEVCNSIKLFNTQAIILFYRGNWCPFCVAQVSELAAQYQTFAKRGMKIVFISSQSRAQTQKLADRFDIPGTFLVDKDNALAKEWGINSRDGLPFGMQLLGHSTDTALPTLIIINKKRQIVYLDRTDTYRLRPLIDDLIQVADLEGFESTTQA